MLLLRLSAALLALPALAQDTTDPTAAATSTPAVSVAGRVTIYKQQTFGAPETTTAAAAAYSGAAAYDPTVLDAPPVPTDAAPSFGVQLQSSAQAVNGLSVKQKGTFLGFSIEMSVINQILGINSTFLQVPFLNLMSTIRDRAGNVRIRVGGNTQETAVLVDSTPDGKMIEKGVDVSNPTLTPPLVYTREVMYMLNNISALVDAQWYLGIPLNDSANLRLGIAEAADQIMGKNLLGFQVGNEPDLYADHGHRPAGYGPFDYFGEFGNVVNAINSNAQITVKNNLIGPNLATGDWTPEMIWDTGFVDSYSGALGALAMEHYPDNNCKAQFGGTDGPDKVPQLLVSDYLNHTSGQLIVAPYINSGFVAQGAGKEFIMFETNSASCGGFPGISNSFVSALWMVDYALQMAHSNFTGALMHIGGQGVYYNPFTPPPTNQSTFHQWTIGPIFYASLLVSEAFGKSGEAQIIDMNANNGNIYTPAYAIYDNGQPSRIVIVNFMSDASGATDLNVAVSINGGSVPSSVKVKYLKAPTATSKDNITWAGQTFGGTFESDGRLQGDLDIQTVQCDTGNGNCAIKVPAPGVALVFLSDDALSAGDAEASAATFSTTAVTKTINTATIDPLVLATSNGHSAKDRKLGSTSKGSASDAPAGARVGAGAMLGAMALGALVVARAWM